MHDDMLSVNLIEQVTATIAQYQYLIAVTTPLTIGEVTLHAFGVLYGSGKTTIYPFLVGVISIITFETAVYAVTQALKRTGVLSNRVTSRPFFKKLDAVLKTYERQFQHHIYFLIVAMKIAPMTKGLVFLLALRSNMSTWSFFIRDTVVTVIWTLFLFVPGYFVGRDILTREAGLEISNTILYAVALFVAIVLFGKHIQRGLTYLMQKIVQRLDQSKR